MDNIMDPETASETVKLFAQELKAVRAQLREAERRTTTTPCTGGPSNGIIHERAQALITENDSLKADNAALQERIARLQDELTQVSSMKSEEDLSNPLQYGEPMSHTRGEIARLLAENEDLIREKENASRNHEKLSILEVKYRRTKAKVHEYNEVMNELRVALSNCIQELDQSKNAVVSEIDLRDSLKDIPYEPVEGQLELSSIQSYPRARHTKLSKDAMDTCKGPYFLNYNEVIWSPSGIALGLVVKPTFQYNPKIHGGTWTKLKNTFDVGKQMDVCYLSGKSCKASRYLGAYERVGDPGTMTVAPETLKYLDREVHVYGNGVAQRLTYLQKLEYLSKCTTLFPDVMPPSQMRMIKNMYKQGVIKLQCFVIRCVAFNQTVAGKLGERPTSFVRRNSPDNIVVDPTSVSTSGGVRKRKRDPGATVHSTKNKKRYGPSSVTA
ncbi:hypothetical protein J3R82DRAFT_934 [Butyriboletus roseoflavus]|nr:hypothetical protein J3R82DRAFT_934 [Butyriboletus roseoflavus]